MSDHCIELFFRRMLKHDFWPWKPFERKRADSPVLTNSFWIPIAYIFSTEFKNEASEVSHTLSHTLPMSTDLCVNKGAHPDQMDKWNLLVDMLALLEEPWWEQVTS